MRARGGEVGGGGNWCSIQTSHAWREPFTRSDAPNEQVEDRRYLFWTGLLMISLWITFLRPLPIWNSSQGRAGPRWWYYLRTLPCYIGQCGAGITMHYSTTNTATLPSPQWPAELPTFSISASVPVRVVYRRRGETSGVDPVGISFCTPTWRCWRRCSTWKAFGGASNTSDKHTVRCVSTWKGRTSIPLSGIILLWGWAPFQIKCGLIV